MKKLKEISTLTGLGIIFVFTAIVFGGVFIYQYFALKNDPFDQQNQASQKLTHIIGTKSKTNI